MKKSGLKINPLFETTRKKSTQKLTSKPVSQHTSKPASQRLVKGTFYFFPNQLKELEKIRFELYQNHNIKTDKSAIMRKALDLVIKDTDKLIK